MLRSKIALDNALCIVEADKITVRPHLIGWEIIFDQTNQQVTMQFEVFRLKLPLRRQFPFSEVAGVAAAFRICSGYGWTSAETVEPYLGVRFDLLMTIKRGKKIRIGSGTSNGEYIARELRHRVGLPEYS